MILVGPESRVRTRIYVICAVHGALSEQTNIDYGEGRARWHQRNEPCSEPVYSVRPLSAHEWIVRREGTEVLRRATRTSAVRAALLDEARQKVTR